MSSRRTRSRRVCGGSSSSCGRGPRARGGWRGRCRRAWPRCTRRPRRRRCSALHLPLVLVQQRDGLDELRYLTWSRRVRVFSSRKVRREAKGLCDEERAQEPLGVPVDLQDAVRASCRARSPRASEARRCSWWMRPRLLAALVDRQHEAAVQQLLVDLDRRGRQEDHHRPFDAVLLRDEPPRLRVLAGGGDRQLAFGLQELQGVAAPSPRLPPRRWPGSCA